jgi:hypothetical protein
MSIEFLKLEPGLTKETDFVKEGREYKTRKEWATLEKAQRFVMLAMEQEKQREIIMKMFNRGIKEPVSIMITYIECNFTLLNKQPDIDENGRFHEEYVECKFKSRSVKCPYSLPDDPKPFCRFKTKAQLPVK